MNNSKFKNQKGITIIFALFGVMVFGVVSTVIYNSAMTNLDSMNKEQTYQQAYLTVSSAAELFVDSVVEDSITYDRLDIELISNGLKTEQASIIDADSWAYEDNNLNNPVKDDLFNTVIYQMSVIDNYAVTDDKTFSYVISGNVVSGPNQNESLRDVAVNVTISKLSIKAEFHINEPNISDDYYMTVEIPYVVGSDAKIGNETTESEGGYVSGKNIYRQKYKIEYEANSVTITKGIKDE